MAERTGAKQRLRLSIDMNPQDLADLQAEAKDQGFFDGRHGAGIYARKILLERNQQSEGDRLDKALNHLAEASINIILKDQSGEQILEMPAALFRTFLTSDSALIDHFIRQNPSKPQ